MKIEITGYRHEFADAVAGALRALESSANGYASCELQTGAYVFVCRKDRNIVGFCRKPKTKKNDTRHE